MRDRRFGPHHLLMLTVAVLLVIGTFAHSSSLAQQEDEQRRFLEVRRRQLELQSARKQLERSQKLAAQGLVPQSETDRDRAAVETAQLNYQQALLSLLDMQPRISVRSAIKTQDREGRKFVRLVISNLTPTFDDSQFQLLNNFEGADPIPEALRTRNVTDIFVSLRDPGGETGTQRLANATISLPYEIHIPEMKYDEEKKLDFQLLRDVDSVTVALTYRNQTREIPVQLEHAAGESEIQVSSSQFSQEADLGGQATYNLQLERPSVDVRAFQLLVVNLPHQISSSFIDLQSQARLSQINFPAGVTKQTLGLRLTLPERADEQVQVDKPLELWALVLDEAKASRFAAEQRYTAAQLAAAGSGRVKLVVIPRGVGKIEVAAASLLSEIETGQNVETRITVRNTGTRRLDNVKLSAEYPLNWRVEITPVIIPSVGINSEEIVSLKIVPPPDAGVGDYEVRLKTESFADNRRIQSEDKVYRVSVKAKTNLFSTLALVGGLILVVIGIVVFGVRLARR